MGHIVLFLGTPYMAGIYWDLNFANYTRNLLRKEYPNLTIEIVELTDEFVIDDQIDWSEHKEELNEINKSISVKKFAKAKNHLRIV